MSEVLAELFFQMLVSLRKVMLTVSMEAGITKTESYTMGRGRLLLSKRSIVVKVSNKYK
jgi:hypothetical protein